MSKTMLQTITGPFWKRGARYLSCALPLLLGASHVPAQADAPVNFQYRQCVAPEEFGARHDGNNDDTAAIQAAIDASRAGDPARGISRGTPVCFSAGSYKITKGLDFTEGPDGWKIYGAGMGTATVIDAHGDEQLPIMDFTGTTRLRISDLTVNGGSGGWTAGILVGRSADGRGDEPYLDNVEVTMVNANLGNTIAALINSCADLMVVERSKFYGPTGIIVSGRNIRNVRTRNKSGFYSGGGNSCNTLQRVRDSTITSYRGEGLLYSGGDSLTVDATYFSVNGTSTAAVRIVPEGGGGGNNVYLSNIRTEVQSSAGTTYVLDALAGSNGGRIDGVFDAKNGPYIHVAPGINLAQYLIQMSLIYPKTPLAGGGGNISNSIISSVQGAPTDLGPNGVTDLILRSTPYGDLTMNWNGPHLLLGPDTKQASSGRANIGTLKTGPAR